MVREEDVSDPVPPRSDRRAVVVVTGEVDVATAPQLHGTLSELLAEGHREVIVDSAGIEFMDARGLDVLVMAAAEAARAGGRLSIRQPSRSVSRLLSLVNLDGVLDLDA